MYALCEIEFTILVVKGVGDNEVINVTWHEFSGF